MKKKFAGAFQSLAGFLMMIIPFILALIPFLVTVGHFVTGPILYTLCFLYVIIFSKFLILNTILLIAGCYFSYIDFPLYFFIVYMIIFVAYIATSLIPLLSSKE